MLFVFDLLVFNTMNSKGVVAVFTKRLYYLI
jgi:hypothetical protein